MADDQQLADAEAALARVREVADGIDQRHRGQHDDEWDSECFACWRADLLRALDGDKLNEAATNG